VRGTEQEGGALVGLRVVRLAAALVLALCALPVVASVASAQACDPAYGCAPTQQMPPVTVSCSLNVSTATSGQIVTATVADAPAGAGIQITVDGNPAASGTANAEGHATIPFTFSPSGGSAAHPVFAVGAGFSASCGTITNGAVAAEMQTQTPPGQTQTPPGTGGSSGVSGGSLARTGVELALLLAIAIVVILVGHRLVVASKRMRRRRARQANDLTVLAEHPSDSLSG
jgi:hypothetical protein